MGIAERLRPARWASPDVRYCPRMSPHAAPRGPASQAECRGFESLRPLQRKALTVGELGRLGRNAEAYTPGGCGNFVTPSGGQV